MYVCILTSLKISNRVLKDKCYILNETTFLLYNLPCIYILIFLRFKGVLQRIYLVHLWFLICNLLFSVKKIHACDWSKSIT